MSKTITHPFKNAHPLESVGNNIATRAKDATIITGTAASEVKLLYIEFLQNDDLEYQPPATAQAFFAGGSAIVTQRDEPWN